MKYYYNYFRDYDPQVGRYIESDPLIQWSGRFIKLASFSPKLLLKAPQLLASYNYVFDSPVAGDDRYGLGPLELLHKLFNSKKCAEAIAAVKKAAARCSRECPVNASLEKTAEFTEKYSDSGDFAKAMTGCVCGSMPEVCHEALTCGFELIY